MTRKDSLADSQAQAPDALDRALRPQTFEDYVGQRKAKSNLKVYVDAARGRSEAVDHVLLFGPPGLGKTTLAQILAREMGVGFRATSGPVIARPGDLAAILTNLEPNDVLFIDEIHRLPAIVEEILYPAMEDYALDIVIGEGPAARSVRLDLSPFTLVGATTRAGLLATPLRDRFGIPLRLDFYEPEELARIVMAAARKLAAPITEEGAVEIAARARRHAPHRAAPPAPRARLCRCRRPADRQARRRPRAEASRNRHRRPRRARPALPPRPRPHLCRRSGRRRYARCRALRSARRRRRRDRALPHAERLRRPHSKRPRRRPARLRTPRPQAARRPAKRSVHGRRRTSLTSAHPREGGDLARQSPTPGPRLRGNERRSGLPRPHPPQCPDQPALDPWQEQQHRANRDQPQTEKPHPQRPALLPCRNEGQRCQQRPEHQHGQPGRSVLRRDLPGRRTAHAARRRLFQVTRKQLAPAAFRTTSAQAAQHANKGRGESHPPIFAYR